MVNRSANLDRAFGALSDPTRRAVLARLALGETSVGELTQPHPMSLPAFMKHLKTLERAGLITGRKVGRVRYCRLTAEPLAQACEWLEQYRSFWEERLAALGRYLAETQDRKARAAAAHAATPQPEEEEACLQPTPPPRPRSRSAAPTRRRQKRSSAPGPSAKR